MEIELTRKSQKGRPQPGSYAFREQGGSNGKPKGSGRGHNCPCVLKKHPWEPVNCNALHFAYTGEVSPNAPPYAKKVLDKTEVDKLWSILNTQKFAKLREELKTKWGEPKRPVRKGKR